jgi:hypothetical protein
MSDAALEFKVLFYLNQIVTTPLGSLLRDFFSPNFIKSASQQMQLGFSLEWTTEQIV